MVDNIKAQGIQPQTQQENQKVAAATTSTQSLKDNFKSISSSLSVVQVAKISNSNSPAKSSENSNASRLSASLQDAVKYSKQAIKVLEDVTAGDLNHSEVEKLLSESGSDAEVSLPERPKEILSVEDIAGDLEALKNNLTSLFESLKQKATQSEVFTENQRASEADKKDLEIAQSKADSTSMQIQFNSREALSAHNGLTLDSVASLLSSSEANKI